jgi:hypothetical protein
VFGMGSSIALNDKAKKEFEIQKKNYGTFLSSYPFLKKVMGFLSQMRLAYQKNRRLRRLLKEEAYRYGFGVF